MKTPDVAIVCAWFNRSLYLKDTVDSMLAQNHENFEVVIVNDGSTDPYVKEFLDSYRDPRLTVIHQENRGFVSAITNAIKNSSARYIAIQGAGDVSLPDRILVQSRTLDADKSKVGVYCSTKQVKVSRDSFTILKSRVHKDGFTDFKRLLKGNPISHGEVMFRRSSYLKAGGYRHFFTYGQDYDLWLRMSLDGSFSSLREILYERRQFAEDGVSTDDIKQIIRIRLSDLAVSCAKQRKKFGYDLLDKYGNHALLFSASRLSTRYRILKKIVKLRIAGRAEEAAIWSVAFSGIPPSHSISSVAIKGLMGD